LHSSQAERLPAATRARLARNVCSSGLFEDRVRISLPRGLLALQVVLPAHGSVWDLHLLGPSARAGDALVRRPSRRDTSVGSVSVCGLVLPGDHIRSAWHDLHLPLARRKLVGGHRFSRRIAHARHSTALYRRALSESALPFHPRPPINMPISPLPTCEIGGKLPTNFRVLCRRIACGHISSVPSHDGSCITRPGRTCPVLPGPRPPHASLFSQGLDESADSRPSSTSQ